MICIGFLVNGGAIVAGGLLGLGIGSLISRRVQATLVSGMAVGTMFIGAGGTFSKMLAADPGGALETRGALMLVMSLAIGAVAGELVDIDGKFERFGAWLKRVSHNEKDMSFLDGFVTASPGVPPTGTTAQRGTDLGCWKTGFHCMETCFEAVGEGLRAGAVRPRRRRGQGRRRRRKKRALVGAKEAVGESEGIGERMGVQAGSRREGEASRA